MEFQFSRKNLQFYFIDNERTTTKVGKIEDGYYIVSIIYLLQTIEVQVQKGDFYMLFCSCTL